MDNSFYVWGLQYLMYVSVYICDVSFTICISEYKFKSKTIIEMFQKILKEEEKDWESSEMKIKE